MSDLIATARPRKKRNKTKNVEKNKFAGSLCSCCTSRAQGAAQGQVEHPTPGSSVATPRLTAGIADIASAAGGRASGAAISPADPELSTAWAKHRAVLNYEKFLNKSYGEHLKHDVSIEKIASTSLGIQGWALADFGQGEMSRRRSRCTRSTAMASRPLTTGTRRPSSATSNLFQKLYLKKRIKKSLGLKSPM